MKLYSACGKQVLREGEHIADAVSTTYAQIIADALNGEREATGGLLPRSSDGPIPLMGDTGPEAIMPMSDPRVVEQAIADAMPPEYTEWDERFVIDPKPSPDTFHEWDTEFKGEDMPELHRVTQHTDGSRSCICGRFWDRDDGDDCPGASR